MAYGLPARGQHDYDDELNNSMEYLRGVAEAALAAANSAQSNANYAKNKVDDPAIDATVKLAKAANLSDLVDAATARANLGAAATSGGNKFYGSQVTFPSSLGANQAAVEIVAGDHGSWLSAAIDNASTELPGRDYAVGRTEGLAGTGNANDTDIWYGQHNADFTTLTASVAAGATSLPLARALTWTTLDPAKGAYLAVIGSGAAGDLQEEIQITAGNGTAAPTCTATQYPHPAGSVVVVQWDAAHQPTFELGRASVAYFVNKKWRQTIRGGLGGNQPGMGQLKLEIDSAATQTADIFGVASRDESQHALRFTSDFALTLESDAAGWSETNGSTTSGSAIVGMSSVTPTRKMLGAYVTAGATFPVGTYVKAVSVTTVTSLSDEVSLPTGTIRVADTSAFPSTGSVTIETPIGTQTISYTGTTATSLTGCTGGTGKLKVGAVVTSTTPQILLSANATATATGVAVTIPRVRFGVRATGGAGSPYQPLVQVHSGGGWRGATVNGKVALGGGGGASPGLPAADLDIYGTDLRLSNGSGYGQFDAVVNNTNGGQVLLQYAGVTRMTFGGALGLGFFGAVTAKKTGWTPATGTATRTTFDTSTVTLSVLAEHVKALIDDLHATAGYGLLNT